MFPFSYDFCCWNIIFFLCICIVSWNMHKDVSETSEFSVDYVYPSFFCTKTKDWNFYFLTWDFLYFGLFGCQLFLDSHFLNQKLRGFLHQFSTVNQSWRFLTTSWDFWVLHFEHVFLTSPFLTFSVCFCRKDCFTNLYFKGCVELLLLTDESKEIFQMVETVGRKWGRTF